MAFEQLESVYDIKRNKNGITVSLSKGVTVTTTKGRDEKKYGYSTISIRHKSIPKEDEYIKSLSDDVLEQTVFRICGVIETGLRYGATPNKLLDDVKEMYPKKQKEDKTIEIIKTRLSNILKQEEELAKEKYEILKELEML